MQVSPGILCRVVGGAFEGDSPNLLKVVQVDTLQGEHSIFGRVWRCYCKDGLVTEFGAIGEFADFAEDWLEPFEDPQSLDVRNEEVEDELVTE